MTKEKSDAVFEESSNKIIKKTSKILGLHYRSRFAFNLMNWSQFMVIYGNFGEV